MTEWWIDYERWPGPGSEFWDDPASSPLDDIRKAFEDMRKTGAVVVLPTDTKITIL